MSPSFMFKVAVEGITDEAILRCILNSIGGQLHEVYGRNGKKDLQSKIEKYNSAARYSDWVVLVDLNHEVDCAPELKSKWLQNIAPFMHFRVAVRGVESWLMADRSALAKYLEVSEVKIPSNPEDVEWPKQEMVNLARQSRSKKIIKRMVPRVGSGRSVGPVYPACMIEFATKYWRPAVAAKLSDSLRRCIERLRERIRAIP